MQRSSVARRNSGYQYLASFRHLPHPSDGWQRAYEVAICVFGLAWLAMVGGCRSENSYPSRPITVVCPWAAGGGTDRVSRELAMLLEKELGQPVSVVNATGGKGVTGHNRGLTARPDGYTLAMITFELNTMHWASLTELTYEDCIPLVSVNEDYAALLVRDDAAWQRLEELESAVRSAPGTLTASGTTNGGAWHLALAGWLLAAGFDANDVVWIPSEGSNPSLQQLISGGVDMVCCSLPEARTLIESGQVRALGLMAPERAVGFESVPTFREQGRDWELGGWRGLAVPIDTPAEIVDRLVAAIEKIVSQPAQPGSFAEFMQKQKFDNTWRGPAEFRRFLAENDAKLGKLLKSEAMKSVSQDRFDPMAYPYTLMGLMAVAMVWLGCDAWRGGKVSPAASEQRTATSQQGLINFATILGAVAAYALLAETMGFLLLASIILWLMLLRLGTRPLLSGFIVILFVPSVYFAFAFLLRVPLPRGWLG